MQKHIDLPRGLGDSIEEMPLHARANNHASNGDTRKDRLQRGLLARI